MLAGLQSSKSLTKAGESTAWWWLMHTAGKLVLAVGGKALFSST